PLVEIRLCPEEDCRRLLGVAPSAAGTNLTLWLPGRDGRRRIRVPEGRSAGRLNSKGTTAMVRIGMVGIGFMGWIHWLVSRRLGGAAVRGVCSRDSKKLAGDWRGIRGNFGPPGEMVDLSGVKKYDRLEAMLSDPDIDLIDVCNPTEAHPQTAIAAL